MAITKADEEELAQFHADLEEKKGKRDGVLREADSRNAPAKPNPCNRPKVKATTHGHVSVNLLALAA